MSWRIESEMIKLDHIYQGDALDLLRQMEAGSVQCCVTSPPYYGLRDYGTAKWEGGDPACDHKNHKWPAQTKNPNVDMPVRVSGGADPNLCPMGCGALRVDQQIGLENTPEVYVEKLVVIFREVRRVLKDDGVLWLNLGDSYSGSGGPGSQYDNKAANGYKGEFQKFDNPNRKVGGLKSKDLIGIPWSVAFALRADGWWLRQDIIWAKPNPMPESVADRCTKSHEYIFLLTKNAQYFYDADGIKEPYTEPLNRWGGPTLKHETNKTQASNAIKKVGNSSAFREGRPMRPDENGRNKRSVWTIATKPYSGTHFATFPPELPRLCILAGSRPGDVILDPFAGSGTTCAVAQELGRHWLGFDISEKYCDLARKRVAAARVPLFV